MGRWFASPHELRESGILGINRRNLEFIIDTNPRELYPRVDNKLLTKKFCEERQIPVPKTYGVLKTQGDIKKFSDLIREQQDFVIKPAGGAAGRGIMVISQHDGNMFTTPGGRQIARADMLYHLSMIISGLYSLGGRVDEVIVEQRIVTHPLLAAVAVGGTPDLRVIMMHGVPVMAMLRLPTYASNGKANLHQGAIAAAVDLVTGISYGGVCKNRVLNQHPDTGRAISGLEMPDWRHLLDSAMKLSDVLELGYLGVDFVFDADEGPVVLEANARPGLAIQLAHRAGLLPRLEAVCKASKPGKLGIEARWELIAQIASKNQYSVS